MLVSGNLEVVNEASWYREVTVLNFVEEEKTENYDQHSLGVGVSMSWALHVVRAGWGHSRRRLHV